METKVGRLGAVGAWVVACPQAARAKINARPQNTKVRFNINISIILNIIFWICLAWQIL
jgi:hypothetical protein